MNRTHIVALAAAMTITVAGFTAAQAPSGATTENIGPNATIVRTVTGKMAFRTIGDGRRRGGEDFRLLVYPDGSRQIQISKDFSAVNAQHTMVARVDARFRPLETFASYWSPAGYKGSIFVTITGNQLRALASGPKGVTEDAREVPERVVVVHHGEIMNGWYLWPDFAAPEGLAGPQTVATYNINAAPRGDAQVSGIYHDSTFTRIGTETITTPAGTFDTVRYRLSELDLWVGGEDKLLIRQTDTKNDREYVLVEVNIVRNR
ncbi:MAG: hypothetical protein SFV21_19000 [Rhodospirillaceae bacterium]|nr:hypothetical protein [Rhodospirillaceae bacterium]